MGGCQDQRIKKTQTKDKIRHKGSPGMLTRRLCAFSFGSAEFSQRVEKQIQDMQTKSENTRMEVRFGLLFFFCIPCPHVPPPWEGSSARDLNG